MYIKFLNSKNLIECSVTRNGNIVTLKFKEKVVVNNSGFRCYLDEKCEYDLSGNAYEVFTTIYRDDEETAKYNGYQLSNDGCVYEKPVPKVHFYIENGGKLEGENEQNVKDYESLVIPTVVPEKNYDFVGWIPSIPTEGEITSDISFTAKMEYVPTLEELKELKKSEIAMECENIIHSGVDVNVSGQWEHFSLTTNDQLNLFGKQAQISAGVTQFEYHQDGHPCRYYTLEEMQEIIKASMEHVSCHTTYCNSLNMWIAGVVKKEELGSIFYGAEIPEEYQSEVLKTYLYSIQNNVRL